MQALDVRDVLTDPRQSGAYFVDARDTDALAEAADALDFTVTRIELAGCRDRDAVLARFAEALHFRAAGDGDFDALAARLGDRSASSSGCVLLLEHADEWRRVDDDNFAALLDVLNEAAVEWGDTGVPFWALLPLPEEHVAKLAY